MKAVRTASCYCIELTTQQMLTLIRAENFGTANHIPYGAGLDDKLAKMDGVDNVEYNGHFGAAVYLRIETEHDTDATHKAILRTIHNHLELCNTI